MDYLDRLESETIYIMKEASAKFSKMGMLWSAGKDSTAMLWLAKKAFFGTIPFPVIYIDTQLHFQQMYDFRDKCVDTWGLNLIVSVNREVNAQPMDKVECCNIRKTQALKNTIREHGFDALMLGIRRDEHGIRAKERVFSPRDKDFIWNYKSQLPELWSHYTDASQTDGHLRIHPLLAWTEIDIWRYHKGENLPVNPLYFGLNGKRYRSLGCSTCTEPIISSASDVDALIKEVEISRTAERAGRAQDKERDYAMQKLRALGYM